MGLTVIKAWCPVCGEQDLSPADVVLHTFQPAERVSDQDFYEFICNSCASLIQRPANVYAVRALRMGQVPEVVIELPSEMLDPKREWSVPLRQDDVLDFVNQLDCSDFLAEQT